MKKRLALIGIIMLFTMVSVLTLYCGQPVSYITEKDEVIEWHSYSDEELV